MQFSTKIDGFEQKDSQGFENSYNSYEQYPLEKFFIFTIYQNYTLALNDGPEVMKIFQWRISQIMQRNCCMNTLNSKIVIWGAELRDLLTTSADKPCIF